MAKPENAKSNAFPINYYFSYFEQDDENSEYIMLLPLKGTIPLSISHCKGDVIWLGRYSDSDSDKNESTRYVVDRTITKIDITSSIEGRYIDFSTDVYLTKAPLDPEVKDVRKPYTMRATDMTGNKLG